jgi:predicted metalloprotease with PDZ domain
MPPIRHTLRFDDAEHHYVEVEARVPTGGAAAIELSMAVWTPGSYLVREFSRNVEALAAATPGGEPLGVSKSRKNRWRITTAGAAETVVTYRLYCREMSVRTNFVDASFALLNGAATFLTRVGKGEEVRPHEVLVEAPAGWKQVVSPLPRVGDGAEPRFRAADYDTLVDSPLYAGNAAVYPFTVDGAPHLLVNEGETAPPSVWDGPRSAADAERIVREQIGFWGVRPYDRYVFFNLITETGGGLEHKSSSVLMTSRWNARTAKGYRRWLGLVSHELFHAWNVKRLRPVELGPFDYEEEVYTPSLWIAEGVTSYYDELLVRRAGLISREHYLAALSGTIERLQTTPGRRVQPLLQASYDAWIKLYRRDENTANSAVSYYAKGQLVAFLLDAEIRRATGGEHSLDDVMRRAYERFSGPRGYRHEEFLALASEVAGTDLSDFFHRALETPEELDYAPALAWYGLRFTTDKKDEDEDGDGQGNGDGTPAAWLGAETELRDGRLTVTEVRRGTPAFAAGLAVEDEILAFGDYRVPPEGLAERLEAYRPGEEVSLLVARRERLLRLPLTFGEEPEKRWKLEPDPEATAEQKARLDAWLGPETAPETAETPEETPR